MSKDISIYASSFEGNLEKIAKVIMTPIQKLERKTRQALSLEADLNKAEKEYLETMRPYSKYKKIESRSSNLGAGLGLLGAVPKGKFRITRGLGGALLGTLLGRLIARKSLIHKDPKYGKAVEKAISDYSDAEEKISEKYDI